MRTNIADPLNLNYDLRTQFKIPSLSLTITKGILKGLSAGSFDINRNAVYQNPRTIITFQFLKVRLSFSRNYFRFLKKVLIYLGVIDLTWYLKATKSHVNYSIHLLKP